MLLNDKGHQVHIVGCAPVAKSAFYDCFVSKEMTFDLDIWQNGSS